MVYLATQWCFFNSYVKLPAGNINVVKTIPCLPYMTGNGNRSTYKNAYDWGMVYGIVTTTLVGGLEHDFFDFPFSWEQ